MPASTTGFVSLFGHDPATYQPHLLHDAERSYRETNCYTDVLIELIHASGAEPLAAMGCTLRMDFEGDQWTFFKPAPADLEQLLGIDIHEMQPYRPLYEQSAEQIAAGRTLIIELDSWYLPDTAATAYRQAHVKSSVAVEAIDHAAERMRYFHNAGYFELEGEDYRGVFRLGRDFSDDVLPPYTELARFDAGPRLEGDELRAATRAHTRRHLDQAPRSNPFERFAAQLAVDLPGLLEGDAAQYHDYAFATVRMVGAAFEVCGAHVDWLLGSDGAAASGAMTRIVDGCKVLSFKLARRRAFDPGPAVADLAVAWDEGLSALDAALA
jgi:hypothetical protein